MNRELLYVAHAMAFGLAFLVLMLAASEVGFRLGRRPNQQTRDKCKVTDLHHRGRHPRGARTTARVYDVDGCDAVRNP